MVEAFQILFLVMVFAVSIVGIIKVIKEDKE